MLLIERASRTVRDANAALAALVGQPLVALVGRSLDDLSSHLDPSTRQALTRLLDDTGTLEAAPVRLMRADGQPRDVLVSGESMRIDGVEHSFCILRDITEPLSRDRELKHGFDEAVAQMAAEVQAARQGAQAARDDAEAARRAQALAEQRLAEFTRVVPHDLKTPLSAVHGFAGLLQLRLHQGRLDEAKAYGEQIERAARRMDEMIVALTQLAQVVQQPLQRQVVDMRKMAQETADLLAAAQGGKRGEMRIDALPSAQGDTALLTQVWQNLLGNAIKFSARVAEPKVRVDSHRDERGTWYRITDNGIGFDMAKTDRLFLPFQRMPGTQAFDGTGVGLSLVRRIVEHHGGHVRLRSAPGVGTVAEFTLDAST
jgi:PAS domain S-box-containing protein